MKSRRNSPNFRPVMETLEPRLMLAGNVIAEVANGTLKITGDDFDNFCIWPGTVHITAIP